MVRKHEGNSETAWSLRTARALLALARLSVLSGCELIETGPTSDASAAAEAGSTERDALPPARVDAAEPIADAAGSVSADADLMRPHAGAAPAGQGARWLTYGFDLDNSQVNPHETVLNAGNVAALRETWRVKFQGGATSTPAIYQGTAYFGGWDGRVYAVDVQTGEVRWKHTVSSMGIRSSPLVTDERVFFAGFQSLIAVDRRDGTLLFETKLHPHPTAVVDSSPKLAEGLVIVGVASAENAALKDDYTFEGSVVAVDAETGELVWRVNTTGERGACTGGAGSGVWSSAAIDPELGLAFIGTGQSYEAPSSTCNDSLLAFHYRRDHQGERVAWIANFTKDDVYLTILPISGTDADVGAAPNLFEAGGKRLVGVGDKGGSYRVFDRLTGALQWHVDLDHGEVADLGGVMTTAAVHEGSIYVTSNRWTQRALELFLAADFSQINPDSVSTLYALEAATGKERWRVALPAPMFGSFAVANGVLYHPIIVGTLYARDLRSGQELWRAELGGSFGAGPSVADGRVFISNGMSPFPSAPEGGFVSSFALPDGAGPRPPSVVDVGPVEALARPLTQDACEAELAVRDNAACSACLCACDASAWGNCPLCWDLSACNVLFCSLTGSADELRACSENFCSVKLAPPVAFETSLRVAPCAFECADVCGLFL